MKRFSERAIGRAVWSPELAFFTSARARSAGKIDGRLLSIANFRTKIFGYRLALKGIGKITPVTYGRKIITCTDYKLQYNGLGRLEIRSKRHADKMAILSRYVCLPGYPESSNKCGIYVADFPFYVGPIPASRIGCNDAFKRYVIENPNCFTHEERKSILTPREMISGGYITANLILEEFCTAPRFPEKTANYYLDLVAQAKYPWLSLPKMRKPCISDLESVRVNPKSKPGYFTSMFFGSTRKDSVSTSIHVARHFYRILTEGGKRSGKMFKYTGVWELGGRAKLVKSFGKPRKREATRLVWMCEEWLTLIACSIIQPFIHSLKYIKETCIFIGKDFTTYNEEWMAHLKAFYPYSLQADWSHFDAYHTPAIIEAAAQLFAWCYPDDHATQRLIAFLTDTVIDKNVVIPPGIVINVRKGMPSGHPLMAVLNSLVNYIIFIEILGDIFGPENIKDKCYALFCGDDAIIYFHDLESMLKIDQVIKRKSEYRSNDPLVEGIRSNSEKDPDLCTLFLKRFIHSSNIVSWSSPKMLRRFTYQEKWNYDLRAEVSWACDQVFTAPGNGRLLSTLYPYLRARTLSMQPCALGYDDVSIAARLTCAYFSGIYFRTRKVPYPYYEFSSGKEPNPDDLNWYDQRPGYMDRILVGPPQEIFDKYPFAEFCGVLMSRFDDTDDNWLPLTEKVIKLALNSDLGDFPFAPHIHTKLKLQFNSLLNYLQNRFKLRDVALPRHPRFTTAGEFEWLNAFVQVFTRLDGGIPRSLPACIKYYQSNMDSIRKQISEIRRKIRLEKLNKPNGDDPP